ncbi:hypothetical protein ACWX0K_10925 [Nitrobacteraceae bacterium UC4446_H13]
MTKSHVSEAVIAAADRAAARGDDAAAQLELMPPTRFHPVDDDRQHRKVVESVQRDRAGRPPGAQNRTTRDMLDFIRKTLGDPMLESARWAMHTPESLAEELGCSKAEAFDRLERIRADLRPYFYAKQAPVDADGKPAPWLTLQVGGYGGAAGLAVDGKPPWTYLDHDPQETQQNQALPQSPDGVSHGDVSHRDK